MIRLVIGDVDKMIDINITKLELINMNITDLSPLKNLTKLKYLNLCGNANISDLSPLNKLTKLTFLIICNRLTDNKLLLIGKVLEGEKKYGKELDILIKGITEFARKE